MKKIIFLLLILVSFNLYASTASPTSSPENKVYYIQSTMQETEPGSGIYIIQGTDGRWYQMNGQDDSGEVEYEGLPTGNPVADRIQDIIYKLDEFEKATGVDIDTTVNTPDGITGSDVPDFINGDSGNVGSAYYLYVRVGNAIGRFILNQNLPGGGAFYIDDGDYFGNVYLAIPQQGGASFEWLTPERFSISSGNYNGLDCWTIWMYNFISGGKNDVSIWTNSILVDASLKNGQNRYDQKNPNVPFNVPGGYVTPGQDVIDKEIENGNITVTTTTTNYFNVQLKGPIDANIKNLDEILSKLSELQIGFPLYPDDPEDGEKDFFDVSDIDFEKAAAEGDNWFVRLLKGIANFLKSLIVPNDVEVTNSDGSKSKHNYFTFEFNNMHTDLVKKMPAVEQVGTLTDTFIDAVNYNSGSNSVDEDGNFIEPTAPNFSIEYEGQTVNLIDFSSWGQARSILHCIILFCAWFQFIFKLPKRLQKLVKGI